MLDEAFQIADGVDGLHEKRDSVALNIRAKDERAFLMRRGARVKRRVVKKESRSDALDPVSGRDIE